MHSPLSRRHAGAAWSSPGSRRLTPTLSRKGPLTFLRVPQGLGASRGPHELSGRCFNSTHCLLLWGPAGVGTAVLSHCPVPGRVSVMKERKHLRCPAVPVRGSVARREYEEGRQGRAPSPELWVGGWAVGRNGWVYESPMVRGPLCPTHFSFPCLGPNSSTPHCGDALPPPELAPQKTHAPPPGPHRSPDI